LPAKDLLERVRSWGTKLVSSATTVAEAIWLSERGVDGIIAQGLEAGGHRGMFLSSDLNTQLGLAALVPQIVDRVSVPVIAAGGIGDARGVQAAFALGASAVQVGSAYLLCDEANTSRLHREAILGATPEETALTNLFSGRPARGLRNRAMNELGCLSELAPTFPYATPLMAQLRREAEARGKADFTPLWCGQNLGACRPISAQALTLALMKP
ncbi:NAD(P)H-dependent flavin oxidoreductase, partial [Shewanella sp.]